jgi:protein SCO1/2
MLGAGAGVATLAGTLALGAWRSRGRSPDPARAGDSPLPLPISAMGWELTDHRSRPVSAQDWLGRPAMIFFGFTWCPDVCPTTLMDIADWLEDLGSDADRLTVALITVDPERDTPEVLANYVELFDPRIVGLTGSAGQIARAAQDFRVRYEKVPREDGDYTMNHTAGVFLFHADGRFASIIDFHEDRAFALPKLRRILT